jgi:hypothetical protein
MCRESKRILQELEIAAQNYNIGTIVTPVHVYIADQLVLKYFAAPMINAIKSKIKNMQTRSSKHFTIDYWVPVLEHMFTMNTNARRDRSVVDIIEVTINQSLRWISAYMLTDYSLYDAETIYSIAHRYTEAMIYNAIQTARSNNVFNIQYVNAILERAMAMANIEQDKINRLADKAESSSSILDKPKVQNTPLDVATAQYNWQRLQEDAELERRFNEIMK